MFFLFFFAFFLILIGISIPILVLVLNPLAIWISAQSVRKKSIAQQDTLPFISIVIAVHNGEALIKSKLDNTLELEYPQELLQVLVVSDGSTDTTEEVVSGYANKGVRLVRLIEHKGKNTALNKVVPQSCGDLILFSDVDAILDSNALLYLTAHFADPKVGGVCGQRVITGQKQQLQKAQTDYIRFDSLIKQWESDIGTLTSNDGKIYMIRRELFMPISLAVTDDFFLCLGVIRQGFNFHFEPYAHAYVPSPSRSARHEVERRRRIVSRSLNGLRYHRELLNIRRFGGFSLRLLINKVLRRMMPIALLLLLIGTVLFAVENWAARLFVLFEMFFFIFALSSPLWPEFENPLLQALKKVSSLAFYFFLGNYGTLLGVLDFLMGKQPNKWIPQKTVIS